MRGLVSFHPIDPDFFDGIVMPLVAGDKINPEPMLGAALALRRASWRAAAWKVAVAEALETLTPPPPPEHGTVWERMRARLERLDHRPDPAAVALGARIEPQLHLEGRPFLVCEVSSERVATAIDDYLDARTDADVDAVVRQQLMRIDESLRDALAPADIEQPDPDMAHRSRILDLLKALYDLGVAARAGAEWGRLGQDRRPAVEAIAAELPARAVALHAQAVPCWVARDVDGLATICRSAGLEPPEVLQAPTRLVADAVELAPGLESLTPELRDDEDVGAWVAPADVPELVAFLSAEGSRIIREATRQGAGGECATLLRKIRECAAYAERRGVGYLEACGILPPGPPARVREELVETF